MLSPAEPLKPEMNALRSSECEGYSLKSSEQGRFSNTSPGQVVYAYAGPRWEQ
jgi:hypothetical protein